MSTTRPHDACFLFVIKGIINQGKPHEIKQYYQFLEREGDNQEVIKVDQVAKELQINKLFTGPVTMQPIIGTDLSKNFLIQKANFSKGVRNKFHSHSIEQVLIVTEGEGIVATDKEEITVRPGDVIFIAAGEKHWHGAAKNTTFSHIYVISPDQKITQIVD
jgi:quercetin dioxygenase-like cupin family protein